MPDKQGQMPPNIEGPFHAAGSGGGEPKKVSPFRFLPASSQIPENQVTAILLVPFMPDGRVVVVEHARRGFDIPGGHRETTDRTNFETARRELLEEAGAHIGQIKPCLVMRTDHYNRGAGHPGEPSYMIIMTGIVLELEPFKPSAEIVGRHLLTPEVFMHSYGGDYEDDMAFILDAAYRTVTHERGEAPEFSATN